MLMLNCNSAKNERIVKFSLVRYHKVEKNYVYNNAPLFEYMGVYYVHQDSSIYQNSELKQFILFKSEGYVTYNREELDQDTAFTKLLAIELNKQIVIMVNYDDLIDNSKRVQCKKLDERNLIYLNNEILYSLFC